MDCILGALTGPAAGDAVGTTVDFESAVLASACGQLTGACYRLCGILERWVERLAMRQRITQLAQGLARMGEDDGPLPPIGHRG